MKIKSPPKILTAVIAFATILVGALILPIGSAFAATANTGGLHDDAWGQLTVGALSRCLNNGAGLMVTPKQVQNNGYGAALTDTQIEVGYTLENRLMGNGSGTEGKIRCNESNNGISLVDEAANALGIDSNELANAIFQKEQHGPDTFYAINPNWESNLSQFWNNANFNIGWNDVWNSSGWPNYSNTTKYTLLVDDIRQHCGTSYGLSSTNERPAESKTLLDAGPLTVVNPDGTISYEYFNSTYADNPTGSFQSIEGNVFNRCQDAIDHINNDIVNDYKNTIMTQLGQSCYEDYQQQIDQLGQDNLSEETRAAMRERENISRNQGTAAAYLEEVKNADGSSTGAMQCVAITGLNQATIQAASNDGSSTTDNPEDACYDSGIDSMSWIICPTITNATGFADFVKGLIDDWVRVDPNQTFQDGTYTAWETFRTIANIVLIIVFLVVIFSQLTGVGVDNYGIKKILPRIIALAILINFSYIICEIIVDISNIIGQGLFNVFYGIADSIGIDSGKLALSAIVDGIIALAAGGGAALSIYNLASGGPLAIAIALLLITALIAIVMFFVMLGARMMAVVILTVVAPVALVMYALPNTQFIFKKWWKVFEACLVIYPICGALYGASFVIQAIATQDETNFVWQMIAVIAPFLPFFALPSLLRGAMGALGVVGGAITAIASGVRGGVSRAGSAVQNTRQFKEANQRAQDRQAVSRAQRVRDHLMKVNRERGGNDRDFSNLSANQRRKLSHASSTIRTSMEQNALDNVGGPHIPTEAQARIRAERQADEAEISGRMTEMADGGIRLGTSASPVAYNSENAQRRIEEIRDNSRGRELTHDEDTEMAALLRAMTTMGGGRGKLSQIVRNSNEVGVGEANHGFMRSLGRAYSNDAAVQSAVNGSDVRARMYLDNFVPGGSGTQPGFNQNFNEYYDASTASGSAHITAAMGDIKTYAEGLNQNDKVATEYIDTLASRPDARRTLQEIFDDPQLYNSIHVSVRNHLNTVAALHGVTGPSAHEVTIAHPTGGPAGGPTGTGHSPGPSWP